MPATFNDQGALQQLFQEAYSPITAYGQGALAVAMQKRREAVAAAEDQRKTDALMNVENIRQQHETIRAEAANKAVFDRWKLEHDTLETEKKEDDRKAAVNKANALGADLPANTPFDVAAKTYVDLRGKSYIEANRRMGAALSGILRSSGTDPAAFAKKVSGLIADDPAVAKALTVKEREDIRNNPDKLADYRKQFANSSTKKYEAFVQAMNQASSTVTADFEKESASKPELIRASADLRVASDTIKAMQKDFQFSPAVEGDAFKAYSDAAKPAPPAGPPQRNFTLPRGTGQPTAAAAPPPPVQSDGTPGGFLTYGLGPAARSLYNSAPVQGALEGLGRATIYPSAPAPAAPVLQPSPGVPTDPSVLSTLRLKRFLQDSATQNNSLFPTAFPAAPDLISPLPGP